MKLSRSGEALVAGEQRRVERFNEGNVYGSIDDFGISAA